MDIKKEIAELQRQIKKLKYGKENKAAKLAKAVLTRSLRIFCEGDRDKVAKVTFDLNKIDLQMIAAYEPGVDIEQFALIENSIRRLTPEVLDYLREQHRKELSDALLPRTSLENWKKELMLAETLRQVHQI